MPNENASPSLGLDKGIVRIAPADPAWSALFEAEAARIRSFLGPLPLIIEHVGSTAVPALQAKPIIDMMAGAPTGASVDLYVDAVVRAGFEHLGENGVPGRNYFRRGVPRTHHLHMVEIGGTLWRDHLAFRDYLRAHPECADEYGALKRSLAVQFAGDRGGYTEAKSSFIQGILARARR